MDAPNRYCRYGEIELYAPSEEGAATILKAVAEPMVRAQRWLRIGNGLSHILLYELLKVFAALGGDRELVLAGSEELDDPHDDAAAPEDRSDLGREASANDNSWVSGGAGASCNGTGCSGGNGVSQDNGNSSSPGYIITNSGNRYSNSNGIVHRNAHAKGNGYASNGDGYSNGNGNRTHTAPQHVSEPAAAPRPPRHTPPAPGLLLLRIRPQDRGSALSDASALTAISSGTCQPVLLVEVYGDDADHDSSSGSSSKEDQGPGSGLGGPADDAVSAPITSAKYRLWARMMEAALHAQEAAASMSYSPHVSGNPSTNGNGNSGGGNGVLQHAGGAARPPVVVWGLLTGLRRWRFYCLREAVRHPAAGGPLQSPAHGTRSGAGKFEILGSRRLRVMDDSMSEWPGLVPVLAALYAILCTPDGLAVRRQGETSQAVTYDMPYDPHRDRLMRFHMIMGAPSIPVYGTVGEWVRVRLDEYVRCRREQKRMRAVVTAAAAAATAATAEAAAALTAEAVAAAEEAAVAEAVAAEAAITASANAAAAAEAKAAAVGAEAASGGNLSSGEWEPVEVEVVDEEGLGGLPEPVAAASGTTAYYEGRLAAAKRQLAESRERASRLRLRARALGATGSQAGGTGAGAGTGGDGAGPLPTVSL